ncbi:RNA polymerase sigma-54 factor [Waddlia chondrophila 2032/99]|uniref:RNA polymerase sigma-54 factor n=2 Tax=Waddlia chondrophila TaxID=71667 RepID=D6YTT7_WADCW|nr:RNA polymerase factor sigma-54 [Waddlia chondrophila]ADI37548.1 RNA polymerase sigma-54 factor [Waddlia chondrophila WSU 86-1044]CCB91791.1 RNA polymerase sigma-54 factor [Waddlia chondrophila 2032/99]
MNPISLNFNLKQTQNVKQLQRLMVSPQMQQALNFMQMPIQEMIEAIEQEMELNPVIELMEEEPAEQETVKEEDVSAEKELDFNGDDFEIMKRLDEDFRDHFAQSENYSLYRTQEEEKLKTFLEQSIPVKETLYEHLVKQARESLDSLEEIAIAELLIGYFDEDGFFTNSIEEASQLSGYSVEALKKVLTEIQTFEPFGVGATSLQHSLLIQLERKNLKNSLSYRIVQEHYSDLLHNRIPEIKKQLGRSLQEVNEAVQKTIVRLDFHPGRRYVENVVQHIVPDVSLKEEGEELVVAVNDDYVPTLRLNRRYLRMMEDPSVSRETKEFIKGKLLSAKWLLKNIDQRNETIFRIVTYLAKVQKGYFINPEGSLTPLTMKQVADELGVHESTVARAVSQKYLDSPRGIVSLKSLFTNAYRTDMGEDISSRTVKEALAKLIDEENKQCPFSDEKLSKLLERRGIHCARRTVAKYRSQLQIGNAFQRREYLS